jgi:hypothetical protein
VLIYFIINLNSIKGNIFMADEIRKVGITSGAGGQAKLEAASVKFLGVNRSDGSAVYELTYSDNSYEKQVFGKFIMLGVLESIIKNPSVLDSHGNYINGNNFPQIVSAYKKAGHLGHELEKLLTQKQADLRTRLRELSALPRAKTTTSKPDQSLPMENFNSRENKNALLKELFSEKSRSKVFSALAPHFRFILQNPSLTDIQITDKLKSLTSSSPQQKADLNKLRESFREAVYRNQTTILGNWLKTDLGKKVASNLEAVLYETASHIHGQIQHQLKKGKDADQKVIDSQVETYIRTTNTLAAISQKNAEANQ